MQLVHTSWLTYCTHAGFVKEGKQYLGMRLRDCSRAPVLHLCHLSMHLFDRLQLNGHHDHYYCRHSYSASTRPQVSLSPSLAFTELFSSIKLHMIGYVEHLNYACK